MSDRNQRHHRERPFDLSDLYAIDVKSVLARLTRLPKRKADFIEAMECALVSTLPEGPDWIYEVKLDGYRANGVRTRRETILYSRTHKNFNKRFPQTAEALSSTYSGKLHMQMREFTGLNIPLFTFNFGV